MQHLVSIGLLLKDAVRGWSKHRAQSLGAALAFYATLAIAPLTILGFAVAGYFFGDEAARGGIVGQIENWVGRDGAVVIEALIQKASEPRQSGIAATISICLLLFGATGVFAELKGSLDRIWEVQPKPGLGLWAMLETRLLSFLIVLGAGALLLASLLLTAALTAITQWLDQWLPMPVWTAYLLDVLVSLLVSTVLFAMVFKLLPDVNVKWSEVGVGAVVTAVLFLIGKFLIGVYIGSTGVGSIYGAASSLVVILVWTFYSSQILFFGAEVIRVYVRRYRQEATVPRASGKKRPAPSTK